jgi:hypothetical protein
MGQYDHEIYFLRSANNEFQDLILFILIAMFHLIIFCLKNSRNMVFLG